ncbi:Manganese/iron superoxide dismutase [Lactifluus subvellereus]|nr:Manganese/iron superoxide dismutase [Lactifluus subvellereus]
MHRLAHRLSARLPAVARCNPVARLPAGAPSRMIHVRVPLPYNVEDGMGDFLPPPALKLIAEDYQQGLLDRLNEQIKGTNLENMSVAQIVISTAPHESQTLAFNYASLALNNSFFLHHLKPPTGTAAKNHESALNDKWLNPERTQTLAGVIAAQMGSLQDLKTYVTAAATGMLGSSGFVWLVTDALGRLGVVPTYGAGTLLIAERRHAHARHPHALADLGGLYQPADASPPPPPPPLPSSSSSSTDPPAGARTLTTAKGPTRPSGAAAARRPANVWSSPDDAPPYRSPVGGGVGVGSEGGPAPLDTLGRTLYPLFCVSVHEHAWMAAGYGVWGKETYLERFWTCLDWAAVRDAYARYAMHRH